MKRLTIYYNAKKTAFQVIKPSAQFNGDWEGLVQGITHGNYHSYTVL